MKLKPYLSVFLLGAACIALLATDARADAIPIIDAHSQLPAPGVVDKVIPLMDRAGVRRTILSFRGKGKAGHVLGLAESHRGRITASVKAKGKRWLKGDSKFFKGIKKQLGAGDFGAMGELLFYHAAKGNKAPEWKVLPTDKQARFMLDLARRKGWPVVTHMEFASMGSNRDKWMGHLEALLSGNRDLVFPLIHMAQLKPNEAGRLLSTHPNVYFITSHANPIKTSKSKQPWTDMFAGEILSPAWKALVVKYPGRFIVGFDNVWEKDWGQFYLDQVGLWRKVLADLPHDVAHAIAHKNAERLWHLPPTK